LINYAFKYRLESQNDNSSIIYVCCIVTGDYSARVAELLLLPSVAYAPIDTNETLPLVELVAVVL
jgi:hypothetical protein